MELEELRKIYQALHEKYGILEDEVSGLKQSLTGLRENLSNVTSRVGAVEGGVNSLNASVGLLSKGLSSVREELGEVSGFFEKVDDLSYEELGEYREEIRLGIETWIEEYEKGYIVYHLGNRKIYRSCGEAFKTAKILALRERLLNHLIGN